MADVAFSQYNSTTESKPILLEKLFRAAVAKDYPIAFWRLPETDVVKACLSFKPAVQVEQPELEQSPFGFLFCPFSSSSTNQKLFIQADVFYEAATGALEPRLQLSEAAFQEFEDLVDIIDIETPVKWHLPVSINSLHSQSEEAFKAVVAAGVEAIQQQKMEKVVLSRNCLETLTDNFNPLVAYRNMLKAYPKAFVSLISVPGVGTWLGASPEILVSINKQQVFKTVALAGTQPVNGETNLANAIWRQKEIEEQGMVERYILSCFKKLRLREYTEVGPRTVVAGNLMHLRTDFKVDLKEVDFPTLGTDMLHLLHPTSAICGLPKEPALEFIKANEGYDRSYYSGFIGPVNSPEGTQLFVNLRCMQLLEKEAVLYAGAGITAESSPEKEHLETEHKMQTMQQILSNFS